ncbi:hypothetical protein MTR_1g062120 [Medicago truncatula]|uniref:Uncharacterized protein n=1 Tax=Medicago truncatula TaxID=3880 RepID=G7IA70_MEDTR|nr:hypothetical protein MTR_1g062120 [Medicago truncatula]
MASFPSSCRVAPVNHTEVLFSQSLEKQGEDRKTPPEAPKIAFILNYSSSEREILNEKCGTYRDNFHLKLGPKTGLYLQKSRKSQFWPGAWNVT